MSWESASSFCIIIVFLKKVLENGEKINLIITYDTYHSSLSNFTILMFKKSRMETLLGTASKDSILIEYENVGQIAKLGK